MFRQREVYGAKNFEDEGTQAIWACDVGLLSLGNSTIYHAGGFAILMPNLA